MNKNGLIITEDKDLGEFVIRTSPARGAQTLAVASFFSIVFVVIISFFPSVHKVFFIASGCLLLLLTMLVGMSLESAAKPENGIRALVLWCLLLIAIYVGVLFAPINFLWFAWVPFPILVFYFRFSNTLITKTENQIQISVGPFLESRFEMDREDFRDMELATLDNSTAFNVFGRNITAPYLNASEKNYISDRLQKFAAIPNESDLKLEAIYLEREETFITPIENETARVIESVKHKSIKDA